LQAIISGLQVLQSEWKEEEVDLSGASATNMMAIMHRATSIMHRVVRRYTSLRSFTGGQHVAPCQI
jgi:hypothetical protein